METNIIEKNDIIDGTAIINRDFEIVTANEDLYKFIGIAKIYSIIDVIHQVDLDDFIDVVNGLRVNQEKTMVIRMKNIDNSYRWVLIRARRKENSNNLSDEYIVMHISDIISMKNQNDVLRNTIQNFRHIMAMENELFYTYDYMKDIFTISSFIDNEIFNCYSSDLKTARQFFLEKDYIPEESLAEYHGLFDDIAYGVVSYTRIFKANKIAQKTAGFTHMEMNGTTIYDEMTPSRAVGRLKNLDEKENTFSKSTYQFNNTDDLISNKDLELYIKNNLELNKNCELSVVKFSIDQLDEIRKNQGNQIADDIYRITIMTMKKILAYRGVATELHDNMFGLVVKDSNSELSLRSFLEHLRTRISWECHSKYSDLHVTLSIGVARYPENSTNWRVIYRKLKYAYERSVSKGGNNFVIFREHLHGDFTEHDVERDNQNTIMGE